MTLISYKASITIKDKEYDEYGYKFEKIKDLIDSLFIDDDVDSTIKAKEQIEAHLLNITRRSGCQDLQVKVKILAISRNLIE